MTTTDLTTTVVLDNGQVDLGLFDAGPGQMLNIAAKVATQFADIVKKQGMSKRIGQSDHVNNSAWQTIGAMTGVFILDRGAVVTELPWPAIADPDGEWPADIKRRLTALHQTRALGQAFGFKASFAVHRNGQIMGWAEASCDRTEDNWASKPGFQLRSQAQTRAQSRALGMPLRWTVKLAGYEPTPLEELDGAATSSSAPTASPSPPTAPWGPIASDEEMSQAANLVRALAAPLEVDGEKFIVAMGSHFDGVPEACVTMLRGLARFIRNADPEQVNVPPDPPPAPPDDVVYPPDPGGGNVYHGD